MENLTFDTFHKVCRVCLLECEHLLSIFSEVCDWRVKDLPLISEILENVSSMKVQRDDGLPSMICTKCVDLAHISFKFKKQCDFSQQVLESFARKEAMEEVCDRNDSRIDDTLQTEMNPNINGDFFVADEKSDPLQCSENEESEMEFLDHNVHHVAQATKSDPKETVDRGKRTTKREKRSANFVPKEEVLLVSLVKKYKDIVECKQSNAETNHKKYSCWLAIEKEFNTYNDYYRGYNILKKKWENIKKRSKKKFAEVKAAEVVPPPPDVSRSSIDFEVKELLDSRDSSEFDVNTVLNPTDGLDLDVPKESKELDEKLSRWTDAKMFLEDAKFRFLKEEMDLKGLSYEGETLGGVAADETKNRRGNRIEKTRIRVEVPDA